MLSTKKLLITEFGSGYGGSSSYLYSFLKYLDPAKFKPCVVLYDFAKGPNIHKIKSLGTEIHFLHKKDDIFALKQTNIASNCISKIFGYGKFLLNFIAVTLPEAFAIRKIIKERKIDMVLLNSDIHYNIPGLIAAKFSRLPCAVRKSGLGVGEESNKLIRRFFSRFVDVFIASSDAERNGHLRNAFPFRRLETVYEGVDLNHFMHSCTPGQVRKELNIASSQPVIGVISRIVKGKGHDDVVKAARLVIDKVPNAMFLIVGDANCPEGNEFLATLHDDIERLSLTKNFIFTGWRTDISDFLSDIDIFVHVPNTWKEGMGIATLEALAGGKPTIVTNNYGLAETTVDGYSGYLIPIGDVVMLSDRILRLIFDEKERNKLGKQARLLAEERFDMSKNVKKIEKILLDL